MVREELANVLHEVTPDDTRLPPKQPKPKPAPKKTGLQKAEERVKRAKDKLAKDPENVGLKKRLASAKKALERAKKVARGL